MVKAGAGGGEREECDWVRGEEGKGGSKGCVVSVPWKYVARGQIIFKIMVDYGLGRDGDGWLRGRGRGQDAGCNRLDNGALGSNYQLHVFLGGGGASGGLTHGNLGDLGGGDGLEDRHGGRGGDRQEADLLCDGARNRRQRCQRRLQDRQSRSRDLGLGGSRRDGLQGQPR